MKENNKYYYTVKFIVVGDYSVGKTNIIYRFNKGTKLNDVETSIGVDFLLKYIQIDDTIYKLQLYDTAGSERYRSLIRTYFNNSTCALIVYDITNKDSFNNISIWVEDINRYCSNNCIKLLISNKDDLNDRKVKKDEGKALAEKYEMKFFETSAVTGHNIDEVLKEACNNIHKKIKDGEIEKICGISEIAEKIENFPTLKVFPNSSKNFKVNNKNKEGKEEKKKEEGLKRKKCC